WAPVDRRLKPISAPRGRAGGEFAFKSTRPYAPMDHCMAYRRTERETARLAARHEAIVEAARALASESGLGAVQIVPVAERAGIAAGTVYRYFPSKDDLVAAVVSATAERQVAAIRAAVAAAPGPLSGLAAAIAAFASTTLRTRRLAWAMLAEAPEGGDTSCFAFRRKIGGGFEGVIRTAIAPRHLPDQPPAPPPVGGPPPWRLASSGPRWKVSSARSRAHRLGRRPNALRFRASRCSR